MNASPGNLRKTTGFCNAAFFAALILSALPLAAAADYRVSAYKATPGFVQIMNEQYSKAVEIASTRTQVAPQYALAANRCVSELMSSDLDAALESCNEAISHLSAYSSPIFNRTDRDASASELLSNRGVVLAILGDLGAAESDFTAAVKLDAANVNAEQNLTYLRSKQVAVNTSDD